MLHIIPTPLAENAMHTIAPYLHPIICDIKIWCVENIRTARRFLKQIDKSIDIDSLTFYEINEHNLLDEKKLTQHITANENIGLMSEAGCAAIADPGSNVVALAQKLNCKVVPHIAPNSIIMALMASGFNGQRFMFHGYLPIKNPERNKEIKKLEIESLANNCTQIFIETPYRNNILLEEILKSCNANTKLCIALNLTSTDEKIISKTIAEWKKIEINLHKIPAVFVLMA